MLGVTLTGEENGFDNTSSNPKPDYLRFTSRLCHWEKGMYPSVLSSTPQLWENSLAKFFSIR